MNPAASTPDTQFVRLSGKKRPITRLVIVVTVFACLLVMGFAAWFIAASRQAQLAEAEVANTNIARMLAEQVEATVNTTNIALIDLAERVEVDGANPEALTRLDGHLVDLVKVSSEVHGLFAYGANGSWLATSLSRPVKGDNSDREYFRYHRAHPGRELHVGPPIKSRSTGVWVIPVSRRINAADGSFGGVALVTLQVNFFERIYDELNVGKTGTVVLALDTGTLLYRRPFDERLIGTDISQGPVMQILAKQGAGSSILVARTDGIERLYSYRRVDGYPFIVAVGRTKDELLSGWRRSSILIGAAGLLICAMLGFLSAKLVRQILIRDKLDRKLRAHSEGLTQDNQGLHVLAHTDKLTGIANRLMFDDILEREFKRAQRSGDCLSLILLDVDFFKKYNDRYGHPAGDAVLRGVGRVMRDQVIRAGDLPARYGGEEFVVVLPSTGQAGAIAVAERIRQGILALGVAHIDAPEGQLSASFGVATVTPGTQSGLAPADVVKLADLQLYEAKRSGRNRVCSS